MRDIYQRYRDLYVGRQVVYQPPHDPLISGVLIELGFYDTTRILVSDPQEMSNPEGLECEVEFVYPSPWLPQPKLDNKVVIQVRGSHWKVARLADSEWSKCPPPILSHLWGVKIFPIGWHPREANEVIAKESLVYVP